MSENQLKVTINDGIATLTLARPPANAMDIDFLDEIDARLAALEKDRSWRALIITGEGNSLSAGLDLKQLPGLDVAGQDRIVNALNSAFTRGYGMERPVVCAANGHALAGGLFLILVADYRILTNAPCRLGLTEVIVGVPFPISALEIARNELAPKSFRTMLATGETFGPEEALARGIVDELAAPDELLPRAHAKALELAALPAQGFAAIKQQQRGRALKRMAQAVDDGAEPQLGGWLSDEARKAAAAILGGGSK